MKDADVRKNKQDKMQQCRKPESELLKIPADEPCRTELETINTDKFLQNIFKTAADGLVVTDALGKIIKVNKAMCAMTQYSEKWLLGRTFEDFSPPRHDDRKKYPEMVRNLLKGRATINHETEYIKKNGTVFQAEINASCLMDERGALIGSVSAIRDITLRKKNELLLIQRESQLKELNKNLSEMNTALEVLLQKRAEDRRALEADILFNVTRLIKPYLDKLGYLCTSDRMRLYIEIIEKNLQEIVAPFSRTLSAATLKLTQTEIQVANHIKAGFATIEIAKFMNISPGTVEFHRKNIRRKLGLQKSKTNLKTYLSSLS